MVSSPLTGLFTVLVLAEYILRPQCILLWFALLVGGLPDDERAYVQSLSLEAYRRNCFFPSLSISPTFRPKIVGGLP